MSVSGFFFINRRPGSDNYVSGALLNGWSLGALFRRPAERNVLTAGQKKRARIAGSSLVFWAMFRLRRYLSAAAFLAVDFFAVVFLAAVAFLAVVFFAVLALVVVLRPRAGFFSLVGQSMLTQIRHGPRAVLTTTMGRRTRGRSRLSSELAARRQRIAHAAVIVVGAADKALAALLALVRDQVAVTSGLGTPCTRPP